MPCVPPRCRRRTGDDASERTSPCLARFAGVLYLVIIVCAGFSEGYVRGTLVVAGDVALAVVLYLLLEPVSRLLSLIAAAFRMAQATILGLNLLHHFTVLLLLGGAGYLTVFEPGELGALALLFIEAHEHGYLIGQMFFGVHCLVLGYLLLRAHYFPGVLGVLLGIAGIGYLGDGLTFFLAPALAPVASPFYLTPVVVAETSLCAWLLVKGVRVTPAHEGAAG